MRSSTNLLLILTTLTPSSAPPSLLKGPSLSLPSIPCQTPIAQPLAISSIMVPPGTVIPTTTDSAPMPLTQENMPSWRKKPSSTRQPPLTSSATLQMMLSVVLALPPLSYTTPRSIASSVATMDTPTSCWVNYGSCKRLMVCIWGRCFYFALECSFGPVDGWVCSG